MPDYVKIDGVAAADVVKISGATPDKVCGNDQPSSGATIWVGAQDDRRMSNVSNSDLVAGNSWTTIDAFASGSNPQLSANNDFIHIAYGKDGSGNPYWVATAATDGCELAHHDDPTAGPWTGVNQDSSGNNLPNRQYAIQWGNGVWIGVGRMNTKSILRSTNGADWAQVDVSGLSGISGTDCYALAQNGSGTWWFAQENRVYQSTQNGVAGSWSLIHTLLNSSDADPGNIRALHYTNSTLVAGIDANDAFVFSAAVSDLTDWSDEVTINSGGPAFDNQSQSAAANGRVVVVGSNKKWTFDVDGKTITMDENNVQLSPDGTAHGNFQCVATDGTTWVAGCYTGDCFFSTTGGDTWVTGPTNVGSKDFCDIAPDVYLPL